MEVGGLAGWLAERRCACARCRVLHVIMRWITLVWNDFAVNKDLRNMLEQFCDGVKELPTTSSALEESLLKMDQLLMVHVRRPGALTGDPAHSHVRWRHA